MLINSYDFISMAYVSVSIFYNFYYIIYILRIYNITNQLYISPVVTFKTLQISG